MRQTLGETLHLVVSFSLGFGCDTPPPRHANFKKLPSWISLKTISPPSPPLLKTTQQKASQVENVHLVSLSKQGKLNEAIQFLQRMDEAGVDVHPRSYCVLFDSCIKFGSLSDGTLVFMRMQNNLRNASGFVENHALKMFCEFGSLVDARQLFDELREKSLVSWGLIISAYAEMGFLHEAILLFSDMIGSGIRANSVIYNGILRCLQYSSCLEVGKQLHSHYIRNGLGDSVFINTAISNMYIKCGSLEGAEVVFKHMNRKDTVTWTAMMVGYTQAEREKDALILFVNMVAEAVDMDEFVFSSVLKACAGLGHLNFGRQIHGLALKLGFESDVSVGTPLVDFYVKCGSFENAAKAFDAISEPNDFSWSALVAGYCRIGAFDNVLKVFKSLRSENADVNSFFYTNIFQACSALAHFTVGAQVHADAIKKCFIAHLHGESALVTMYSRCCRLDYAYQTFKSIIKPDTVAWTAIIAGYAYQGDAVKALELFRNMQGAGVKPSEVTFVAVLTACSHSGFVKEGKLYLDSMSNKYGVVPTIDHYVCMIDIYSRAGFLQEALDLITTMPFSPDAMSWKCLLGGCWTHKNLILGKIAAEKLFELDPDDTSGYILMFNLYATVGKWKEAADIRKVMTERNLKKELSCSWIHVRDTVHRFIVGDKHHPQTDAIYSKLEELNSYDKKGENCVITEDDISSSLPDRKEQLLVHSERLAISFGLISTSGNTPIVIFKNLRACKDCHDFAKQVSVVSQCEIIIRDSFRFHRFNAGECSCNDYW